LRIGSSAMSAFAIPFAAIHAEFKLRGVTGNVPASIATFGATLV